METIRPELLSRIESTGVAVKQASTNPDIFTAKSDEYIFFVVLDSEMISGNAHAPPGTDAEISVHTLSDG